MTDALYTIGHSTHTAQKMIDLLRLHGIKAIADVRSSPYSRMNPQFNRDSFSDLLEDCEIAYVFLGRELGARSKDRSCYSQGKVQYDLLARTGLFQAGLDRVTQGMKTHRVALLCAEKDPLTCHRTILVCRHLVTRGVVVKHIREDGRIETHEEALSRLLAEHGLPERDLFRDRSEIIEQAYSERGDKISYAVQDSAADSKTPLDMRKLKSLLSRGS